MTIDAIKKRSENMERLREDHPKTWMELLTHFEIKMVVEDRKELVTEAVHLLERAQRAEAKTREAAAREAVFKKAVNWLWGFWDGNILVAAPSCDIEALDEAWGDLLAASIFPSKAGTALLERLEFLEQDSDHQRSVASQVPYHKEKRRQAEAKTEDLHGALQAALAPLEAAADALVPPGARVEEAVVLIEETLVVIREELEE